MHKKPRIFIGMLEIAGYYSSLSCSLRERGYKVTAAGISSHIYEYEFNDTSKSFLIKIYDALLKASTSRKIIQKKTIKSLFIKKITTLLTKVVSIILFFWSLPRHDVFIFCFGSSFFPKNYDLPILKIFKKKVICNIAHGSDARPPYINGAHVGNLGYPLASSELSSLAKTTKRIKNRCRRIEKYSDIVIGAPLTSHFLGKPFINTFYLGVPFREPSLHRVKSFTTREETRILHSPSNPIVKGSSLIKDAISSLRNKGYSIEYVELVGKPNKVVLEELSMCDFVVDQAYSDFPLAGFATEAAWFAKPAIVGGYGWELSKKLIAENIFPPSHICHPNEIESAIEKLITDKEYCHNLGQRAYIFVNSTWSMKKFTDRYLQLIYGEIPEDWWATPEKICYVHGCGISEETLFRVLSQILNREKSILQLTDKPLLEEAFIEFHTLKSRKHSK